MPPFLPVLVLMLAAVLPPAAARAETLQSLAVAGTAFRFTLSDGTVLPDAALAGAVLAFGDGTGGTVRVRIDAVVPDPKDAAGEIVLYAFSVQDAGTGTWTPLCLPDLEGQALGFPLQGAGPAEGTPMPEGPGFRLTCTAGAEAKCVRMGYRPWRTTAAGVPLGDHFRACVRMIRADYCGDGVPHTRDGTLIDIYDRIGIQSSESSMDAVFEAGWGPDGAVCVHKTRIAELLSLEELARQCPRLAGRLGSACSEAALEGRSEALLFNRSR